MFLVGFVHSPNTNNDYRDILKDAERDLIIKKEGGKDGVRTIPAV